MTGEEDDNQQCCEGAMDRFDEQRAWGGVKGKEHKVNKMGLEWGHLQDLHVGKEAPTRHHGGQIPQTLSGNMLGWSS